MPTVREIEQALYELAPKELAMGWDNVGLLVGECGREVETILVALDVTEDVVREARDLGAELIVAHHPVMNCAWRPVQSLRDDDLQGRLLMDLVRGPIAVICMHTNLDAAEGGVNDALAESLGLTGAKPTQEGGVERVAQLLVPVALPVFLQRIKESLAPNGLRYVDGGKPVSRVAVGGGACGDFLWQAAALGCDTFVTSDVKYNQFLDAKAMGLTLIDAGHFPTEDVVCPVLVRYLQGRFPRLNIRKSASHREVIEYYR